MLPVPDTSTTNRDGLTVRSLISPTDRAARRCGELARSFSVQGWRAAPSIGAAACGGRKRGGGERAGGAGARPPASASRCTPLTRAHDVLAADVRGLHPTQPPT